MSIISLILLAQASTPVKMPLPSAVPPPPIEIRMPPPLPPPPAEPLHQPRPATPKGEPENWVSQQDYPASAESGEQGVVLLKLAVAPEGRVSACQIARSSGHSVLDETACSVVSRRARFNPATDSKGMPVLGAYNTHVRFNAPAQLPPKQEEVVSSYILEIDGKRSNCRVEKVFRERPGQADLAVGQRPCPPDASLPYRDEAGKPVRQKVTTTHRIEVEDVSTP